MCALGWSMPAHFFLFFFRCERALRRVPNARRTHDFSCLVRLLSLSSIARVKEDAESALERFEELQKEFKKSPFVGSAQFSLVV